MRNIYKSITFLFFGILFTAGPGFGQGRPSTEIHPMVTNDIDPIICTLREENMHSVVPLRKSLESLIQGRTEAGKAATFEVSYFGFSSEEQAAFQHAVDIWSGLLNSDVTIRISAAMRTDLGEGTLGSTGWGGLNANFDNAQDINTWFVVALAEKIAGTDLNDPADADIIMSFNKTQDWYLGTDQSTPTDQFDFVSVALHEIGHGLGFFTATFENNGIGEYGRGLNGIPMVYTTFLEDDDEQNLIETFDNNSTDLGAALTGNSLFFNSFSFSTTLPKINAPATYSTGSSIAHLDENNYNSGTPNSLMTSQIGRSESVHEPGLALDMLQDMGWISMDFDHDRLKDSETTTGTIPVTAVIQGDNPIITEGVILNYSSNNFASSTALVMSSTANPDEYAADLPLPGGNQIMSYYIEANDSQGRNFTDPGEAPEFFHQFTVAPDTIPPVILHQPLSLVFTNVGTGTIEAQVLDNIEAGELKIKYKINGVNQADDFVPKIEQTDDGFYAANHKLVWDLAALGVQKGDLIEYQLEVTDASNAGLTTIVPPVGFYEITIDEIKPAVEFYSNDFNSAGDDFAGNGFVIEQQSGFSNGAMFSDHPYRSDRGETPDDTVALLYLLKSPIIISAGNPSIEFDEVVLVEPGEPGTVYGDDEFWDYVIVEGSTDLGITWTPFEAGYDVRQHAEWRERWESNIVVTDDIPDSEATGSEDLYKKRKINMLASDNFEAGEEVLVRFKVFADQLAVGWGWAVDNLKIQIDEEAPVIAHIAPNYLNIGDTELALIAKVTDNAVLDSVTFEVSIDGVVQSIGIDAEAEIYQLDLSFAAITATSTLEYRIVAVDSANNPNTTYLPETGSFKIPVAELGAVKTTYFNDFNGVTNDFFGSNFTVEQAAGFANPAIQTLHPYSNAPSGISELSYLLKYPIKLNASGAYMRFDEVALVDPIGDRVVVEASKDNGVTWLPLTDSYSASRFTEWIIEYNISDGEGNSIGVGSAPLVRAHFVNLLSNDNFSGGDEVLIRFTMRVDTKNNGWGWTIDNVDIQGPTTAVDNISTTALKVYPNPVNNGRIHVVGESLNDDAPILEVVDLLGHSVYVTTLRLNSGKFDQTIDIPQVKSGMYLIKVISGDTQTVQRIIVN